MKLHENREAFLTVVNEIRINNNIEKEYVEKDYWLTLVLKEVFNNDIDFVFKGGTSLSKCYHIINRFSEDVDIAYVAPYHELSRNQIEKRFKRIEKAIDDTGLEIENLSNLSRGRYFNQFRCPYTSMFSDNSIEKKVLVELAVQTPSFPNVKVQIQSFIGEYFDKVGRHDLTIQYGLEPFEVLTQSLERTLVDKTFAICDYYLNSKFEKHSRHLYDLSKILPKVTLNEEIMDLFKSVKTFREQLSIALSSRGDKKIYEYLGEIIKNDSYKNDYERLTRNLLYDHISYGTALEAIAKIKDFLELNHF